MRVGSSPDANRSRSLVTSRRRTVIDVDVLIDHAADPHHHVVGQRRRGDHRLPLLQRERLFDHAPRHARGAHRFGLDVANQLIREVGAHEQRQRQHRHDRRRDEREKQLPVEARTHFAHQHLRWIRPVAMKPAHEAGDGHQADERHAGERCHLGEVHEVIERRQHRIADDVDAGAIVGDVGVIACVAACDHGPERIARTVGAREDLVAELPRAVARREDGQVPPAVDRELDVAAGRAEPRFGAQAADELEIRALRRDETQRAVVEHHVEDHGADDALLVGAGLARADAALRVQHAALVGAHRNRLTEDFPVAALALVVVGRFGVGQVEREPADERAIGAIELDRRREPELLEIGGAPQ